uniref:Putative ixodes 26 kDa salivary protein n=1 Tax=Ixodes ricinus TaxID=34613 RepID=A0A0K8R8Q5_IXORI
MRTLMGAILFSLLILGLSVKSGSVKLRKKPKNPGNTNITIAYLLDGNDFNKQYNLEEAQQWLQEVQEKTSEELSRRLKAWLNEGHVYGGWILGFVKNESMKKTANPDIICVLTKHTIYNDYDSGMLAYSLHRSLCDSMVPMLLTYKKNEVKQCGELLSQLIQNSTRNDFKKELNKCKRKNSSSRGKRPLLYP